MRKSTLLVLIAVGAALVGFAFASAAERIGDDKAAPGSSAAAKPQVATLGWLETQGPKGERLEFAVRRFEVVANGWRARLSVTNDSKVAFDVDESHRSFGLMLFSSGDRDELAERNRAGTLPTLRPALRYEPDPPAVLEPGKSWTGTISARGALVAGSWVRFVFGTFDAIGRTPDAFTDHMVWITDHAYRLRG
jgi:hypothetical protein